MNTLKFDRVSVSYGPLIAVREVMATVKPGSVVGIIGPNGSGKSTLIKAVAGVTPLRSGEIRFAGSPLQQRSTKIAYVPQVEDIKWDFPVTAADAVMMGRYRSVGWLRRPGATDRQMVEDALGRLGLDGMGSRHISQFSGGQQQRIFLARTLVQEPQIVLLDEPNTGVDIANREVLHGMIQEFSARDVTVLMATHDLDEVRQICDTVLILNCEMVAFGPTASTFNPQNLRAAFGGQIVFFAEQHG